ncbi:JmjC-domain-containing protein [Zopfia rhizophila CBS 207.26]|uniref:JmjC-domain-containing protein n=1 Tax=Zopfia rhizophila CBS 207.26 TaxID=1314779 RepID=A0A6A6DEJ7_9PEZI|nr:JmjC-domain-containing protein [Zopfia rhizophila CBS 207.26]
MDAGQPPSLRNLINRVQNFLDKLNETQKEIEAKQRVRTRPSGTRLTQTAHLEFDPAPFQRTLKGIVDEAKTLFNGLDPPLDTPSSSASRASVDLEPAYSRETRVGSRERSSKGGQEEHSSDADNRTENNENVDQEEGRLEGQEESSQLEESLATEEENIQDDLDESGRLGYQATEEGGHVEDSQNESGRLKYQAIERGGYVIDTPHKNNQVNCHEKGPDHLEESQGGLVEDGLEDNSQTVSPDIGKQTKSGQTKDGTPTSKQQKPYSVIPLMLSDMGKQMVPTLQKHAENSTQCYSKYKILHFDPPQLKDGSRPKRGQIMGFKYKWTDKGTIQIEQINAKFKIPTFSCEGRIPSQAELKKFFQDTMDNPPKRVLPYYIGPPLPFRTHYEPLVDPGYRLQRRNNGNLPGINQIYHYISLCPGSPATLHIEDVRLGSVNLVLAGKLKVWLLIPPKEAKRLEKNMRRSHGKQWECSQDIRHLNTLVSPEELDRWGIEYYIEYCGPGEMIETRPGTYHQVLNMGANLAESVNIEFDDTPDMPADYKFCDESCPLRYPLRKDAFQLFACSNEQHHCLSRSLVDFKEAFNKDIRILRKALDDTKLERVRKIRLIQMMVQCEAPTNEPSQDRVLECDTDNFVRSVMEIIGRVKQINLGNRQCTFEERMLLLMLARRLEEQKEILRKERLEKRKLDKRASAHGEYVKDANKKKQHLETATLHKVINGAVLESAGANQLKALWKEGSNLKEMHEKFGLSILTMLPGHCIRANEIYLKFSDSCFASSLKKPIHPVEYNNLHGEELQFFMHWLPRIYPKLNDVVETRTLIQNLSYGSEALAWCKQREGDYEAACGDKRTGLGHGVIIRKKSFSTLYWGVTPEVLLARLPSMLKGEGREMMGATLLPRRGALGGSLHIIVYE